MKEKYRSLLPAAVLGLALVLAPGRAHAHPVVPLLAIAALIGLSDLHWPYADKIMETLDPFCEQEEVRGAWLEVSRNAVGGVAVASETAKMAAMVKLHGRLQGWAQSHGCAGRIPPYSSRRDARAWKFCEATDRTLNCVGALVQEKASLMRTRHDLAYTGLIQGSCRFSAKFRLEPAANAGP